MLVRVNGTLVTRFEPLEAVLDDSVGVTVELQLQRGGKLYTARLKVDDLDAITPAAYLEFGDARRAHAFLPGGARVSSPGARRVHRRIGLHVRCCRRAARRGHHRGEFEEDRGTWRISPPRQRTSATARAMTVRYVTIDDPNGSQLRSDAHRSALVPGAPMPARRPGRLLAVHRSAVRPRRSQPPAPASAQLPRIDDKRAAEIAPSLAFITFDMPYSISGVTERNYHGAGLIIDAERGLLITDRNTVPVSMGDVRLTFAGTIEIPGEIVYVHPLHNLAVIHYDPKLIGTTPVRAAQLDRPRRSSRAKRSMWSAWTAAAASSPAPRRSRTSIRCSCRCRARCMFRESNLEVASLVNAPDDFVGVLARTTPGACAACGPASPPTMAANWCRRTAASRATWSSRDARYRARGHGRCIRSRRNSSTQTLAERTAAGLERCLGSAHLPGQSGRRARC